MPKEKLLFITAAAQSKDLLYVSFHNKKTELNDEAHSIFGGFRGGKGGVMKNDIKGWNTQAMRVLKQPSEKMVAISEDEGVFAYAGGKSTAEKTPDVKGSALNLGIVDGYAYACGVWRQVFKRGDEGKWIPLHAPMPTQKEREDAVIGFLSISGFSEKDIYAFGYGGEIWHYNGNKWSQIDSPASRNLTTVVCASDGNVCGCGEGGTIAKGRNNEWTVMSDDAETANFYDAHWFAGSLYIVTLMRMLRLNEDGLNPVKFGKDYPKTCYRLTSAEGVMWSIGTNDIYSFDGKKWTRIE